MNKVYLVKRQYFDGDSYIHDELIAVCSTLDKARIYVDMPNYDIIITRFTIDGDADSEILIENVLRRSE